MLKKQISFSLLEIEAESGNRASARLLSLSVHVYLFCLPTGAVCAFDRREGPFLPVHTTHWGGGFSEVSPIFFIFNFIFLVFFIQQ